ncbi:MAG: laccase domain-containing protein, partial [Bifidobacteriaceae bacterium]|nr:laccase domain-containing protein [Bifidobacteriaceae bacterium]
MPGRDDSGLGIRAVDLGPGVRAGFTSAVTGDLRAPVGRERARAWAGVPLVLASQVHGTRLVWAGAPGDRPDCALCETNCEAAISDRNVGEADAIGLSGPGAAAVIQVADCVPVLLADPVARLACA